jgi:hypothetical protein
MAHEMGNSMTVAAYPGLQHAGDGRVYGEDGTHITWDAYATADPLAVVVAHYHAAFAREAATGEYRFEPREHGGGVWRQLHADGEVVAVVDVLPVDAPGPHQELGDRLPRPTRTVVIVSRRW